MKRTLSLVVGLSVSLSANLAIPAEETQSGDATAESVFVLNESGQVIGVVAVGSPGNFHAAPLPPPGGDWPKATGPVTPGTTVIGFDTLPGGGALSEGQSLKNQYAQLGVVFTGTGITEDVPLSGFPGVSPPNYLTFGGYSPGPGSSLGCQIFDWTAAFDRGASVTAVEFIVFASFTSSPATIALIARDSNDQIVDSDEHIVTDPSPFPTPEIFDLSVSAPEIASVELSTLPYAICAAIDDFTFTAGPSPGVPAMGLAGTLVSVGLVLGAGAFLHRRLSSD